MRQHHSITDKDIIEFKKLCKKEGIHYDTDREYREAAQNMYGLVELLIGVASEEDNRKQRLVDEPNGFLMSGEGRNCSLCEQMVFQADGWYDIWGFKCMNCQDAVNKKIIPGSLCRYSKHKKYYSDSALSWKSGLHIQTIRKLIRQGRIVARRIPNGPYLVLVKDNPDLLNTLSNP